MDIVLADVAPQPEFSAGPIVVIVLICAVLAAALAVLLVWLVRRSSRKP